MVVGTGEGIVKNEREQTQRQRSMAALARTARLARLVVLVLLGVAWCQGAAQAQTSAAPQSPAKTYWNKPVFQLPVMIEDPVRAGLSHVVLYFKDHPSKAWMIKEKALPTQRQFTVKATQDGEYWFAVVTVDKSGRSNPVDVQREPPGVIVVLDSKAPHVEVRPYTGAGSIGARLEVRDENLDPTKTRFEFQTADMVWRSLDPLPNQPDTYIVPPQARFTGMVRASATDRANNTTVREINLGSMLMGESPPSLVDDPIKRASINNPPVLKMPDPPKQEHPKAASAGDPPSQLPNVGSVLPPHVENKGATGGPQYPLGHIGHSTSNTQPPKQVVDVLNKQLVKSTHVLLDYQIEQAGASGVGKVEIWVTSDQGQSWRRLGEDADRKSPAEIDLPGEGLFGVSLVVTNGRGFGGTPPAPGDTPDWWIEVDATKPMAELVSVRPGVAEEANTLVINWMARDRNFASEPIDLYYAVAREGPWTPIAKGLKNDGRYRWSVPQEVGAQTYIRLIATDKAGNATVCETAQPVPLDDQSRPRARVVGVVSPAPLVPPQ